MHNSRSETRFKKWKKMKVFYFVKVGKSDLVIHVTIVMAKKIKHEINFSFFYAKKD